MSVTGRPDGPPTFCGASINDKATGLFCVIGALAALRHRDITGRGCLVDTSLLETATFWVEQQLNGYLASGIVPQRHGTASNVITPYQAFDTADAPFVIAAGNDRLWARCAAVLGHPEWATDPRFATGPQRNAYRPELVGMIASVLRTRTRAEWLAAFEAAGVPVAPVNDIGELARSEQLQAVDLLQTFPDTGLTMVGLPISFDHERPLSERRAPTLGEHNSEVLGR
jgi:crotonobetainyl-CoA:carnitine CoA-transferase CaiB-like acyl-CoA transferase